MRDRIMVIDDEANLRRILEAILTREGYDVTAFEGFREAQATLDTERVDVLITDLSMPDVSGMEVLEHCRAYSPDLPVIMITAYGTIEKAVAALKTGAFDFIMKPFDHAELIRVVRKALESRKRRSREPALSLVTTVGLGPVPVPLFGDHPSTIQLRTDIDHISENDSPVMILGEVGSGKRSIAYEVHRRSLRSRFEFIQLHCEAVADVFQITELFGVEKGATPVHYFSKPGALELAGEGTVVLEEFDSLSIDAQNGLFAALDSGYFRRLGGVRDIPLSARVMVTSSKLGKNKTVELTREFHPELFYKLSVNSITLLPLRERKDDIRSHLASYFVERSCKRLGVPTLPVSENVYAFLLNQDWPGNIGELERALERIVNQSVEKGLPQLELPE